MRANGIVEPRPQQNEQGNHKRNAGKPQNHHFGHGAALVGAGGGVRLLVARTVARRAAARGQPVHLLHGSNVAADEFVASGVFTVRHHAS